MNLDHNYLIWQRVEVKRGYSVIRFDEEILKRSPESLVGLWAAETFCVLDAERATGDPILTDSLWNRGGRLFISPRLKMALEQAAVPFVEYWPLRIIDRTGRTLGPPYFYAHLLNAPDCLDLEASGAKHSRILPGMAEKIERLVFKEDPKRPLWHPLTFTKVTLASRELAKTLGAEGFTGFRFMGLFDYGKKGDLPPHPSRHAVDALHRRPPKTPATAELHRGSSGI